MTEPTTQELVCFLEQVEWLDDRGRECGWCRATRFVMNKEADIGTDKERKARDNHRSDCRWLRLLQWAQSR